MTETTPPEKLNEGEKESTTSSPISPSPPHGIVSNRTTKNPMKDPVLVVVRIRLHNIDTSTEAGRRWNDQINERLRWISDVLFPSGTYWRRKLVILTERTWSAGISYDLFCTLTEWEIYKYWGDLYNSLMLEDHQFAFALFLNLRRDEDGSGDGYARVETPEERLILRGCALSSHGNVLFGDWGLPAEQGTRPPLERLLRFWDEDYYKYVTLIPENKAPWRGLAKFARNGNYLRAFSRNEPFPADYLERIARAVEGKEFNEETRERAMWIARWDLFFPSDLYKIPLHTPRFVPERTLRRAVGTYTRMRAWWASSARVQLAGDFFSFFMGSVSFVTAFRFGTTKTPPSLLDVVVWAPLLFAIVFVATELVLAEPTKPQTRPKKWWERPRRFMMLALELFVVALFFADDGKGAWYAWLMTGLLFRHLPRDFTQNDKDTETAFVFYDAVWTRRLPVAFLGWFLLWGAWWNVDATPRTMVEFGVMAATWWVVSRVSGRMRKYVRPKFVYHWMANDEG